MGRRYRVSTPCPAARITDATTASPAASMALRSRPAKLIKGGGASVNNEVITEELAQVSLKDLRDGAIKLSAGKKRHALVKPTA